ncbi:MAG: prepilin-type N-terminal cleavage/methylation domain-containing protein [Patescibacteria group bacterium]
MFKNKKQGFTLIELLVVIAIIGILASVVLASLNSARKKGRDARRVADIKQVQLALELYFDANRSYPQALSSLAPAYLPTVPADPLTGTYSYAVDASPATTYHLGATLEESTNPALNSDRDCNSAAAGGCGTGAYTNGFDGTVALKYDVTP